MSCDQINQKIEKLLFEHLIDENRTIEYDDNVFKNHTYKYRFIDTPVPINKIDIKKTKFLNDVMEILSDVHLIINKVFKPVVSKPLPEYTSDIDIINDKIDNMDI